MTDTATFLADAWVSLCAALGAATVLLRLQDLVQRPEIVRRFEFCLWVLVVLMLARIGHWGDWGWLFSVTTSLCAALIPLAALVLSEGLMRRHAPPVLKQFCAWGAVTFGMLGLFQFGSIEFVRLAGLLLFQTVRVGWCRLVRAEARQKQSVCGGKQNHQLDQLVLFVDSAISRHRFHARNAT